MRPGAPSIPARGVVRVALAEDRDEQTDADCRGFRPFTVQPVAPPSYQISVGSELLILRSAPGDLFRFDFETGGPFPEARVAVSLSPTGGSVNGIVQWVGFEMDEEGRYENLPHVGAVSAFAALFYPLRHP
jgi:protein arginine N-methyltransferase 7